MRSAAFRTLRTVQPNNDNEAKLGTETPPIFLNVQV